MGLRDRLVDALLAYLLGALLTIAILGIAKVFSLAYQFIIEGVTEPPAIVGFLAASMILGVFIYALLGLDEDDTGGGHELHRP